MSVETLHASEMAAGFAIGLSEKVMEDILKAQKTRVVSLGKLKVQKDDGTFVRISAWRGISGPDDGSMDKGGSRMTIHNVLGDLETLPQDMWAKLHQAGLTDVRGMALNGGKLLFEVDPGTLSHSEKIRTFEAAAEAMHIHGRAGHDKSVPAGDMGTNHTDYMDAYAAKVCELTGEFWQGSITGKSLSMGGLEFRPHATGYGVYLAADYQRQKLGLVGPTRLTISGAGNVGGYLGYYASQDPNFSVRGYSDLYGTLYVENDDPAMGIKVDESVLSIMDNANFRHDKRYVKYEGDKLKALRDLLKKQQPELKIRIDKNDKAIMQVPTEIFVPASVRDLVNEETAPTLSALGITEAGNDTISAEGYAILSKRGISVVPGTIANAGGVASSMDEHEVGITGVVLSFDESKDRATRHSQHRLARLDRMAEFLETQDNMLAASALGVAGMAQQLGHAIPQAVKDILVSDSVSV